MTSQAWVYVLFAGAIIVAAYQTQAGWLFIMGGITLGMIVLAWAAALQNLAGVRLRALAPAPTWQGGVVELPVILERTARGASRDLQIMAAPRRPRWWFRWWRDTLVPTGWPYLTIGVPATGRADAVLRLPAPTRGEFPLPPLVVQSAWPLGLIAATLVVELPLRFLVYPVGPYLREVPWLAAAAARRGAAARAETGQGQLLRSVREYRAGDPWRQIHWRTTARLGVPHVKESEREAGEELELWLDLRADVHTPATLEHMITVATALVTHARELGRTVRLTTQPEAEPEAIGRPGDANLVWLALARAIAPVGAVQGPERAIALSPGPLPGWHAWAAALILCPAEPPASTEATATCPVGADIAEALAAGRLAP